jgi:hypothetical protein
MLVATTHEHAPDDVTAIESGVGQEAVSAA